MPFIIIYFPWGRKGKKGTILAHVRRKVTWIIHIHLKTRTLIGFEITSLWIQISQVSQTQIGQRNPIILKEVWTTHTTKLNKKDKLIMKLIISSKLYLLIIICIFCADAVFRSGLYNKLDTSNPEYSNKVSFVQGNLQDSSINDKVQCIIGCINEGLCIGYDFKSPNCFLCYFDVNSQTYRVRGEFYTQLLTPTVGE